MTLFLFSSIGLQLINPLIVRHFIDTARSTEALQKLIQAGLLFIGVGLIHQAVSAFSVYVSSDVSWRTTNRLRADLTLHILGLDISFHSTHTPGELIERVDGDVDRLANFFFAICDGDIGWHSVVSWYIDCPLLPRLATECDPRSPCGGLFDGSYSLTTHL